MTKQEQIAQALLRAGKVEVQSKTSKYRVFTRTSADEGNAETGPSPATFYFVGNMGALRTGTCVSKSFSRAPTKLLAKYGVNQ